jgi:hypothetical protein
MKAIAEVKKIGKKISNPIKLLAKVTEEAQGRRLRFASGGISMASTASLKIFARGGYSTQKQQN